MALEKNLEKLNRLLSVLDEDQLTKEDFIKAFENVVNFIKKIEQKNELEIELLQEKFHKLTERIFNDNTSDISDLKKKTMDYCVAEMKKMYTKHEKIMKMIEKKMSEIKDGKDADEKRIVKDVISQIKLPEQKEFILDNAKQVRDKLETLQGKERLSVSAIDGLEEKIKAIPERPTTAIFGGRQARYVKFSFTGDGSTTAFTLPREPAGKGLALWAYYQGQWLQPGVHFTIAKLTFTTTFTAENNTTIEGFLQV